MSKTKDSK
jgi:hypothetical protein